MSTRGLDRVVGRVAAVLRRHAGGDGELLERFVRRRDEAAFEVLVRRHGPMVLGVCRRVLRHEQDAEDAFQATFLLLARKAASVRPRGRVGNWLYGVARRTALEARRAAARRRAREARAAPPPQPPPDPDDDLRAALDRELTRLPDRHREVVVLCDLEGKGRKEVARQLGCPEGTVASRLARARALLAARLARRGLTVSGAALLAGGGASASVPAPLAGATARAATSLALGQGAGLVPARAVALMEGVLKTMLLTKLKIATAALLAVILAAAGTALLSRPAVAQDRKPAAAPDRPPAGATPAEAGKTSLTISKATLEAVDAPGRGITVTIPKRGVTRAQVVKAQADYRVAKFVLKEATAQEARLKAAGAVIKQEEFDRARAVREQAQAQVRVAEAVIRANKGTRLEGLPVAGGARVVVRGRRAGLADLRPGMRVTLQLAADGGRLVVTGVRAGD
jgi:RNA polymerase sigma factor (sigma-70 family)